MAKTKPLPLANLTKVTITALWLADQHNYKSLHNFTQDLPVCTLKLIFFLCLIIKIIYRSISTGPESGAWQLSTCLYTRGSYLGEEEAKAHRETERLGNNHVPKPQQEEGGFNCNLSSLLSRLARLLLSVKLLLRI